MDIKDIIRNRRIELGLTMADLAKLVDVSEGTISRWESGNIANMRRSKIASLAKALDISPSVIMGWDKPESSVIPSGFLPLPRVVKKPRLGTIVCGEPIDTPENFDGFDDVPENIHCDFTLKCEGDSMVGARIYDGDIVYIRQQPSVENGQIAAVCIDGEKTLKRVYWDGETLILQPENPKYQPMVYSGTALDNARIIGLAVGFTSLIR